MSYSGTVIDNCCDCGTFRAEGIFSGGDHADNIPPDAPSGHVTEVNGKSWTDIPPLEPNFTQIYTHTPVTTGWASRAIYRDTDTTGGLYIGTVGLRDQFGSAPSDISVLMGKVARGSGDYFGHDASLPPDTAVNGTVQPFTSSVIPYNIYLAGEANWPIAGGLMMTGWLRGNGYNGVHSQTVAMRARHKFKNTMNSFQITVEVWTMKSDGVTYGWDAYGGPLIFRHATYFQFRNYSLLSGDTSVPGGTWIEPAMPSTADSGGGGDTAGFIGRFNIAIRGETKAAFNTRTGLSL